MTRLVQVCNDKKRKKGISSAEIAELSGLSVSTVRNFLNYSQKSPSIQTAGKICKVLGVSIDSFFEIELEDSPQPIDEQLRTEIQYLRSGIKTRDRIIWGIISVFLISLVITILFHLWYLLED